MKPCLAHLKQALDTAQQASRAVPSASDMPLLLTYSNATLSQSSLCIKARMQVLRSLTMHKADSTKSQHAVLKYLQQNMPSCRVMQRRDQEHEKPEVATSHLHLIHQVGCLQSMFFAASELVIILHCLCNILCLVSSGLHTALQISNITLNAIGFAKCQVSWHELSSSPLKHHQIKQSMF